MARRPSHPMHPKAYQAARAANIAKSLGVFAAARFLAKRGWSLESALWQLARSERDRTGPDDLIATN